MLQRSALHPRKYTTVEDRRHLDRFPFFGSPSPWVVEIPAHHDHSASRAPECFVCSTCDDVAMLQWIIEQPCGNQAGGVGDICHEQRTHFISDFPEALIVPFAAVCRSAANDQFRFVFCCLTIHFFHIHPAGLLVDIVMGRIKCQPAIIDRRSMGQVTAMGEVKAEYRITGFQDRQIDGRIGLCPGMRLHVGIFSPKQGLEAFDSYCFNLIYYFTSPIISLAGISLRIFICQARTHRFKDSDRRKVFRGNQLNPFALTVFLLTDQFKNSLGIHACDMSFVSKP